MGALHFPYSPDHPGSSIVGDIKFGLISGGPASSADTNKFFSDNQRTIPMRHSVLLIKHLNIFITSAWNYS